MHDDPSTKEMHDTSTFIGKPVTNRKLEDLEQNHNVNDEGEQEHVLSNNYKPTFGSESFFKPTGLKNKLNYNEGEEV